MSATDIPKVLYAPHKAFKKIIENPKYLGVIVVLIIAIAAQTGFLYVQSEHTYGEKTMPAQTQLDAWTSNSTLWQASSNVVITNSADSLNNTHYGNGSLQFAASNSNTLSIALGSFDSVNCGPDGFQNLSMRIKIVDPSATPSNVVLTLYSLSDSNYFQYDLTPEFADSVANVWNNITVPVGSEATGWQSSGSPTWENITSLKVDFTFPASSDITLRVAGLFFRGQFQTPLQISSSNFIVTVLFQSVSQFLLQWLLLTALLYIFIKAMKGNVIWRPLFIATGFALIIIAIQALLSAIATVALPQIYIPIEYTASIDGGFGLLGEAQAIANSISAMAATYYTISSAISLAIYTWMAVLGAFVVRALVPEFTLGKSILISAAAVIASVLINSVLSAIGI